MLEGEGEFVIVAAIISDSGPMNSGSKADEPYISSHYKNDAEKWQPQEALIGWNVWKIFDLWAKCVY